MCLVGRSPSLEAKLPGPVSHQLCDDGQSLNFLSPGFLIAPTVRTDDACINLALRRCSQRASPSPTLGCLADAPVPVPRRPTELHSDPGPGAAPLPCTPATLEPPARGPGQPGAWWACTPAAGTPPSPHPQRQLPCLQLHFPRLAVDQSRPGPCLSATQSPTGPLCPPCGRQWGRRPPGGCCHPRAGHRQPAPGGWRAEAAGALPVPVAKAVGLEVGFPHTCPAFRHELNHVLFVPSSFCLDWPQGLGL